ncbi:MAG TPA: lycopene cyclase domain-containing protein [Cyclobacteriaceae bacterium]|nr:lycopene cyclase domain-containing protein [Cyclobacteriaceae bacterium]
MKSNYLYLVIDLASIALPFAFSFHPRANFSKKWNSLWPAILLTATFFLIWDEWFTSMGVWGFNPEYLTGIYFFSLPLEEVLFFICIPYACVFTYEAVGYFLKPKISDKQEKVITYTLAVLLLIVALLNTNKWYTSVTFILCSGFLFVLKFRFKVAFLPKFFLAFLFILIPFFIVNGILTGTGIEDQVVWYNDAENLGIRMGTIPVEDTFYGLLLILMNVTIFEQLQKRTSTHSVK